MLKKMKKMKHSTLISIVIAMVFVFLLTSVTAVEFCTLPKAEPDGMVSEQSNLFGDTQIAKDTKASKATKMKKPAQVKGLKKVKVGKSSVKIKFNKVKGADGYQVLIYQRIKYTPGAFHKTPIVYAKTTKKTAYTLKGLMPNTRYKIKVRAYKKDKKGKAIYGKVKSINVNTTGRINETYIVCNTCQIRVPNGNVHAEHYRSALKIHNEVHAGYTINWR